MFRLLRALIGAALLAGCTAAVPPAPAPGDAVLETDQQAFVEAMKPRRGGRPVVVVLALNDGTETTDLLLPHAVLQRAGVADVQVVAPRRGPVRLYPALQVEAPQDIAGFDQAHPAGADYVIVPAMQVDDDAAVTAWLRRQAGKGARVIGVCVGGLVVGRAGLLDGRRFASHWHYRSTLTERHPGARYVPHRRYVVDRGVATTTGITASVPTMLALVEAIGGREKAQGLAAELGVASWTPVHDSSPFHVDATKGLSYLLNKAVFWGHERRRIDVQDGSDDVALAFVADAWSRTGRVSVEVHARGPVTLRSGLVLVPDPTAERASPLPLAPQLKPVQQLDRTLCEIAERFGASRRDWVMLEMEYPAATSACP